MIVPIILGSISAFVLLCWVFSLSVRLWKAENQMGLQDVRMDALSRNVERLFIAAKAQGQPPAFWEVPEAQASVGLVHDEPDEPETESIAVRPVLPSRMILQKEAQFAAEAHRIKKKRRS